MAQPETILRSIPSACEALCISRSRMYLLINEGRIPTVKLGRLVRIPERALRDFADSLSDSVVPPAPRADVAVEAQVAQ